MEQLYRQQKKKLFDKKATLWNSGEEERGKKRRKSGNSHSTSSCFTQKPWIILVDHSLSTVSITKQKAKIVGNIETEIEAMWIIWDHKIEAEPWKGKQCYLVKCRIHIKCSTTFLSYLMHISSATTVLSNTE